MGYANEYGHEHGYDDDGSGDGRRSGLMLTMRPLRQQ